MNGFLDDMGRASRVRADAARAKEPTAALERRAAATPAAPPLALAPGGFDVIAEIKRRSPAAGALAAAGDDGLDRARDYARAGAVAVSVLTEPTRFDGELGHLEAVAAALRPFGVPAMRKDFLVDPYQVLEARAAGAGGVLLILRMLSAAQCAELLDVAERCGLFVLLEAFDADELARAGELARARAYAGAGAASVSVLTEPTRFDGALEHLEGAAAALRPLGVPAMRKDFLVDPYQVLEARAAGAGGVLLILRMLSAAQCAELIDTAARCGLFVLLEAFDAEELARAGEIAQRRAGHGTLLVGLNCRDLQTLAVVPTRFAALASSLPAAAPAVAESGVATAEDARQLRRLGYRLALVGSALMTHPDPAGWIRAVLRAARTDPGQNG